MNARSAGTSGGPAVEEDRAGERKRGLFSRGAVLSCDGRTEAIVGFLERELERQGLSPVERRG